MSGSAPVLHRGPQAVFLDAGNTLLHIDYGVIAEVTGRSHPGVVPEVLRSAEWAARVRLDALLAHPTRELAESRAGRPSRPIGVERASGYPSTESQDIFRRFMTMILEESAVELSPESLGRVLDELEDYHLAHNLWGRPHPFAGRVLADLHRLGVKLAVVSNSGGDLEPLLARHGLLRDLDVVIDSGIVGVEKPDPRIFLLAAERVGVAPGEAVHVGDLYSVDVVGARAAGVEPVLVDPGNLWPQSDCVKIRDLTALPELVRRARGAP